MKKSTRIVSLVLVLLMLVGMMPLSLFATSAGSGSSGTVEESYDKPLAMPPKNDITRTGATIKWYQNFEALSGCEATVEGTEITLDENNKYIMDANGFTVYAPSKLYYCLDEDGNKYLRFGGTDEKKQQSMLQVKPETYNQDYVFSMDVKLDESFNISGEVNCISVDGKKILGLNAEGGIVTHTGVVVGYLNSEKFTTVAVRVDDAASKYYVYINGVCTSNDGYDYILTPGTGHWWLQAFFTLDSALIPVCFDNVMYYYKGTGASPKLVYVFEREQPVFDRDDTVALPSDQDIADIGATKLYVNNFEGIGNYTATFKGTPVAGNALEIERRADNSSLQANYTNKLYYHIDGSGNRYLRYAGSGTNANQTFLQAQFAGAGATADFVCSLDIKLNSNFSLPNDRIALFDTLTSGGELLNLYSDGSVTGYDKSFITRLNAEAFTTIAVRVMRSESKYYVYVNGVCTNRDGYALPDIGGCWNVRFLNVDSNLAYTVPVSFDNFACYYKNQNDADKLVYIGEKKEVITSKPVPLPTQALIGATGATCLYVENFEALPVGYQATAEGLSLPNNLGREMGQFVFDTIVDDTDGVTYEAFKASFPDKLYYHSDGNNKYLRFGGDATGTYRSYLQVQLGYPGYTDDFVCSLDIKLDANFSISNVVNLFTIERNTLLYLQIDGSISGYGIPNVTTLSSDEYKTIAVRVSRSELKYYVYVNGVEIGSHDLPVVLMNESYCYWNMRYFDIDNAANAFSVPVCFDNLVSYHKSSYATEKLTYIGLTDTDNGTVALPSDQDIANIGAKKLYVEDFETLPYGATAGGTQLTIDGNELLIANKELGSYSSSFTVSYPDGLCYYFDENGNKYLSFVGGSGTKQSYLQAQLAGYGNSNHDYVYSLDIKLNAGFTLANSVSLFKAAKDILYLNTDGSITGYAAGTPMAYLDESEFTTVAVKVMNSESKYYVYINGVCVNDAGYALPSGTDAWSARFFNVETNPTTVPVSFDNFACYYKSKNDTTKLTYIGECEKPAALDKGDTVALPTDAEITSMGATKLFTEKFDGPVTNKVATFKGTNLTNADKKAAVLGNNVLNINYPGSLYYHLYANGDKCLRLEDTQTAGKETLFQSALIQNSAIDLVYSMDIKLSSDYELGAAIALFRMRDYSGVQYNFVNLNTDNSISIPNGAKLAYLNSDTFTTVAIRIDMAAGKYYVYVDGVCTNTTGYATAIKSSYWLFNFHGVPTFKGSVYLDNMTCYWKDSSAAGKLAYIGERDVVAFDEDFEAVTGGYEATPEGTAITDNPLAFEGAQSNVYYPDKLWYHLDENGNKYLRFENTRTLEDEDVYDVGQQTSIQQMVTSNGLSGADFVYSIDVKLGSDFKITQALPLIRLVDYGKTEVNLVTLFGDGAIAVSGTSHRVGYLSSEEFTSVAVRVDVAANKYYIYVNDICVDDDGYVFIPDNATNMERYGTDGVIDARKYTVTFIRVLYQNPSWLSGSICFDNIKCYYKSTDAFDELPYVGEDTTDYDDEFVDGVYYADGRKLGAYVMGHTLGMNGEISVNYFLNLTAVPKSGDVYVEFTINGEVTKVALNTLEKTVNGYKVTVSVPAAEMTDAIQAQVKYGDTVLWSFKNYIAVDIAKALITGNYPDNAKAAAKAMLNYAAACQEYFNRNTGNLANKELDEADKQLDATGITGIGVLNANANVATYSSSQLALQGTTVLYHHFNLPEGATLDEYTVSVTYGDGVAYDNIDYEIINGRLRVRIIGIKAAALDEAYTVTLTRGEESLSLTYSAMKYAELVVTRYDGVSGYEALVKAMKALYMYNVAADAYNLNPNA